MMATPNCDAVADGCTNCDAVAAQVPPRDLGSFVLEKALPLLLQSPVLSLLPPPPKTCLCVRAAHVIGLTL
jgi:hypothetical protein